MDQPRILVVDDREDEGLEILRALWSIGLPVMFFHFSQARLQAHAAAERMSGVRLVFMDINLVGGAFGDGGPAFAAVEQTLRTVLAEGNGPYILATWSEHDEDAERLFQQLRQRLPPKLMPVKFTRIKKENFIGEANAPALQARIRALLNDAGNAKVLIEWEDTLRRAAGDTVDELLSLARKANAENPDAELGTVLRALADAEASTNLTEQNAFRSAGTVLNSILADVVERAPGFDSAQSSKQIFDSAVANAPAWKHRLNRFLLVDVTAGAVKHAPGDVFLYPSSEVQQQGVAHAVNRDQFIAENFVQKGKRDAFLTAVNGAKPVDKWKLVLVETSPPCDHAENKIVWHRYALAVELPLADKKYVDGSSLRVLPAFCMADGNDAHVLAVNARPVVTLPPDKTAALGQRRYRLRERVVTDLNGWISAQQSRQGYVYIDV